MKHMSASVRTVLALVVIVAGFSGAVRAEDDPCAGSSGAAYGLCTAYCVAMECPSQNANAAGCDHNGVKVACDRVAARYQRLVGTPISCFPISNNFMCTCAGGILSCSATGLESNVTAYLNIDLTAYQYGRNGVGDALTDGSGNVQFPSFDVLTYLEARQLTLTTVIMQVTNQAGTTLAQAVVPVCSR